MTLLNFSLKSPFCWATGKTTSVLPGKPHSLGGPTIPGLARRQGIGVGEPYLVLSHQCSQGVMTTPVILNSQFLQAGQLLKRISTSL